ncbi:MAG: hypothetical protein AAF721_25150, partial [Myxococcota bacterium]
VLDVPGLDDSSVRGVLFELHHAALKPIVGADRVARFHIGLGRKGGQPLGVALRSVNGLPAWVVQLQPRRPRDAPLALFRADVDAAGMVWQIQTLIAPPKLDVFRPA